MYRKLILLFLVSYFFISEFAFDVEELLSEKCRVKLHSEILSRENYNLLLKAQKYWDEKNMKEASKYYEKLAEKGVFLGFVNYMVCLWLSKNYSKMLNYILSLEKSRKSFCVNEENLLKAYLYYKLKKYNKFFYYLDKVDKLKLSIRAKKIYLWLYKRYLIIQEADKEW